jgi:hypothetical protein
MDAIDAEEAGELIRDAWRMVVPKRLALDTLGSSRQPLGVASNA